MLPQKNWRRSPFLRAASKDSLQKTKRSLMIPRLQLSSRVTNRRTRSLHQMSSTSSSLIKTFAFKTEAGTYPGKPNQDRHLEYLHFGPSRAYTMFAVFDGHGPRGEKVSEFAKKRLPVLLEMNLTDKPRSEIAQACSRLDREISMQRFDCSTSGSTMVSVLLHKKKLWCANIGDSRALLGRLLGDSKHWMSIALSRDHKPDLPDEMKRIEKSGGEVHPFTDESGQTFGPPRVWIAQQLVPGLAMARALGDTIAKTVGVIAEPEIAEYDIVESDKFLVIGSDGIFEFLSNESVVKTVVKFWKKRDPSAAARALVKKAKEKWIQSENTTDDITCIVIFIN